MGADPDIRLSLDLLYCGQGKAAPFTPCGFLICEHSLACLFLRGAVGCGWADGMYVKECGCSPIKLQFQEQTAGWIWPVGCSWLTPAVRPVEELVIQEMKPGLSIHLVI